MQDIDTAPIDPKKAAAMHVIQRKNDWWNSMQTKRKTWARLDKRYYNFRDDVTSTGSKAQNIPRSNLGVPLAAETVDTALAQAHANLLGAPPFGRVRGREEFDSLKAEVVQQVMDYQQEMSGFAHESQKVFRDALKYGLGVAKIHFCRETMRVPRPPVVNVGGELVEVQTAREMREVSIAQYPKIEHRSIQDVFFPMDAPTLDDAEGIIDRIWATWRQIRTAKDGLGQPLYDPMAVMMAKSKWGNLGNDKDEDATLKTEYTTRKIGDGGLHKSDKPALLEYTGRLPEDIADALVAQHYTDPETGEQLADPDGDWIVTIVDGIDEPLRCDPSPYLTDKRMWIFAKAIDDPGYLCGISIIEFVEKLGITIDELYNVVMDNMNFVINQMYYVNEHAGIDDADLVSSPGKFIKGTRPPHDAIMPLPRQDISQAVIVVINALLHHYKEYTGITNLRLGQSEGGRQTATEIASLMAHSNTRLGQFERMLEQTYMKPAFELSTILNQQFIDEAFTIRIFKDSQYIYPKVAPEDIQGLFDYVFEGSSKTDNAAMEIGQAIQLLQINSSQLVPIYDPIKVGIRIPRAMGWPDPESFMNPAFQEQFMAMRQMQMMQMMGETARALTPEQQAQRKAAGKSGGGVSAPGNAPQNKDFKAALATVQEAALPQMPTEG